MAGNYLYLHQPKVGELFDILKKEKSSSYYSNEFFWALEAQNSLDSIPWALNRMSHSSSITSTVWNYLENFRGTRFEIQNSLNGMPQNLDLRLLATREMPSEFSLQGQVLIPNSLEEFYKLERENKIKILIDKGNLSWIYPLFGEIRKIDGNKCFLEFQ